MGRRPGPEVNEERCTSKPMNRLGRENSHPSGRGGGQPRTHDLRELFEEVKQVKPNLWLLYEKHKYAVEVMNDAYISARCLPRTYGEDVVKGLYEVATVVLNEVGIC